MSSISVIIHTLCMFYIHTCIYSWSCQITLKTKLFLNVKNKDKKSDSRKEKSQIVKMKTGRINISMCMLYGAAE